VEFSDVSILERDDNSWVVEFLQRQSLVWRKL